MIARFFQGQVRRAARACGLPNRKIAETLMLLAVEFAIFADDEGEFEDARTDETAGHRGHNVS
jgi:hypothetical protein